MVVSVAALATRWLPPLSQPRVSVFLVVVVGPSATRASSEASRQLNLHTRVFAHTAVPLIHRPLPFRSGNRPRDVVRAAAERGEDTSGSSRLLPAVLAFPNTGQFFRLFFFWFCSFLLCRKGTLDYVDKMVEAPTLVKMLLPAGLEVETCFLVLFRAQALYLVFCPSGHLGGGGQTGRRKGLVAVVGSSFAPADFVAMDTCTLYEKCFLDDRIA